MSRSLSALQTVLLLGLVLAWPSAPLSAQVISLRTAPLAAGEQFLFLPSDNLAMGGVSIAVDDASSDPYENPAKGALVTRPNFFSSLHSYSISERNGGATTFPIGVALRSDRWFGGLVGAIQRVDMGRVRWSQMPQDPATRIALPDAPILDEPSATNRYFQGGLGRTFGEGRYSVGVAAMLADLDGMDGAEEVFANAWSIDEFGTMADFRVGLIAELSGDRRVEAVLVHNRISMTHRVTSVDWTLTDSINWFWTPEVKRDANLDRSSTWGAQFGYVQPLGETSWRAGGTFTVNRKFHPKIPTYDLRRIVLRQRAPIPRDPGDSWAYSIGAGISYEKGPTRFAADIVYEPAESNTWADAESDVTATDGTVIPTGAKTVENWFDFSNAAMRLGWSHRVQETTFQLGLRMRSYDYRLKQLNYVEIAEVLQTEQWTEWTPTWGLVVTLPGVELRYLGMASAANRFPSPSWGRMEVLNPGALQDTDLLAPPTGALVIPDESVVTHRITVSVPIR